MSIHQRGAGAHQIPDEGSREGLTEVKEDSQAMRQRASQRQARNGGEQRWQERDNGKRAGVGRVTERKRKVGLKRQRHTEHTQVDTTQGERNAGKETRTGEKQHGEAQEQNRD